MTFSSVMPRWLATERAVEWVAVAVRPKIQCTPSLSRSTYHKEKRQQSTHLKSQPAVIGTFTAYTSEVAQDGKTYMDWAID